MTPDTSEFERVIDEALDALAVGEPRQVILARFSTYAAQLVPILEAAEAASASLGGDVPAPDLARGRQRFLRAAQRSRRPATGWLPGWRMAPARLVLASLLFVVLAVFGVGAASAGTLPGDALYPVKRVLEGARLSVTVGATAREAYADTLRARRRLEAAQAAGQGREATVVFEGQVESVERGQMVISGVVVLTRDHMAAGVGDTVLVEAHTRARTIIADTITVIRPASPEPTPSRARTTPTSEPARATPTATPSRLRTTSTATPTPSRPTATDRPTATPTPVTPEATRPLPTSTTERPNDPASEPTATGDRPAEPSSTPPPDTRPTETATGRPR